MSILRIERLTKRFGPVTAVGAVSLDVKAGERVTVVGASGCGKTTLLRLIAGLEEPDEGAITWDDRSLRGVPPRDRGVAMVFQDHALYPHLSARDNIAFPLVVRGLGRREARSRAEEMAHALGIAHVLSRRPNELSGGEQQRVALARAMIRRPEIFLLDEPLASLDAPLRRSLRELIVEIHEHQDAAMLYVTHDQAEAMTLGMRMAVMSRGRLLQIDAPGAVYARPADLAVAQMIGSPPIATLRGTVRAEGKRLFFEAEGVRFPFLAGVGVGIPAGRELILGLRPEDLAVTDDGAGARATVVRVEDHGHERLCRVRVGATFLHLRTARPPSVAELSIAVRRPEPCFFDPETGRRIGA